MDTIIEEMTPTPEELLALIEEMTPTPEELLAEIDALAASLPPLDELLADMPTSEELSAEIDALEKSLPYRPFFRGSPV